MVYINGASALFEKNMIKPISNRNINKGSNHHFFLSFKKRNKSLMISILRFFLN